jgi:chemotaxis protein methyltransferase CheR
LRILELKQYTLEELINKIENKTLTKKDLLTEITVNVTEMFRDPSFWKVMKAHLQDLLSKRDKIRIWHAGCSSGEEVYSMLILLKELDCVDRVEIIASDIDSSILERAKSGKILTKHMELNPTNYNRMGGDIAFFNSCFNIEKDFYRLSPDLLSKVSFREIDLVKTSAFTKCDLILCRNVLIYFNQVLQNKVLRLFLNSLFMGGNLAIGAKESIVWCEVAANFETINLDEKFLKKTKD